MKATTLFNRATLAALLASSLLTATIPAQAGRLEDLEYRLDRLYQRKADLELQQSNVSSITEKAKYQAFSRSLIELAGQISDTKHQIQIEREKSWK